jgi:hypothetical protein
MTDECFTVVVNNSWSCLVWAQHSGDAMTRGCDVWRAQYTDGEDRGEIESVHVHRGDLKAEILAIESEKPSPALHLRWLRLMRMLYGDNFTADPDELRCKVCGEKHRIGWDGIECAYRHGDPVPGLTPDQVREIVEAGRPLEIPGEP